MQDPYGRKIDYLRISVTDRCNLRCFYCMPSEGVQPLKHKDILTYEEIIRIVRIAAPIGIRKVRITGGEPLLRKNISFLIKSLKAINGIENLSLTTNGVLLEKYADELAAAGLDRINVSLDSFHPQRYAEITRGGSIDTVLKGIERAEKAGLKPVRINMVPIRGFNENEIEDFARITLEKPYQVRFIEFMPIGAGELWSKEKYIPVDEIKSVIEKIGCLTPVKKRKSGPARYYRFNNASGVVGFINAVTHQFCEDCNRLRLTSEGKLRPCLFSETEIDLKTPMRRGASDAEIKRLINLAIELKPEGHSIGCSDESEVIKLKPMSKIGG
ncbi:MAG: molybdenum cofactor biosynthesis protein [Nitrospirae bacterium]|nr:molybdenum cofactor biosynthesis protein [Nitrospirota bacterium]